MTTEEILSAHSDGGFTPISISTPGRRLRTAREDRQWSIEDVARRLNLPPRFVEAIEHDNYTGLPEATYVRGYLRTYARLVSVPIDVILAEYEEATGYTKSLPVVIKPHLEKLPSSNEWPLAWALGIVAIVLIAVVTLWLKDKTSSDFNFSQQAKEIFRDRPEETMNHPAGEDIRQPLSLPPSSSHTLTGEPIPPLPTSVTIPIAQPGQSGGHDAAKMAVPPSLKAGDETGSSPIQENKSLDGMMAGSAGANQTEEPPPSPTVEEGNLVIRVAGLKSWVDVRDADQKALLARTLSPGTIRTIKGKAPFALNVGYAPAVTIEYNGQPFDFSKHVNGTQARFTVSGKNQPIE